MSCAIAEEIPVPATDALAGRVILITGAYGGLGETAARACASNARLPAVGAIGG